MLKGLLLGKKIALALTINALTDISMHYRHK